MLRTIIAIVLCIAFGTVADAQSCNCDPVESYGIAENYEPCACDGGTAACDSYCDSMGGSRSCGMQSLFGMPWMGYVDALFLDRDAPDNLGGNGLVSLNNGPVQLDNGSLDPSVDTGYRIGLLLGRSDCVNIEFLYSSDEWDERQRVLGDNNLNSVLGTVNYLLADDVQVGYESEMDNFELNRWVRFREDFSMMIGFRYFSLDEEFLLTTFDDTFRSDYRIGTENNLYGAQLGGRYQSPTVHESIFLSLSGKAGIFGNSAEQQVLMNDVNNTIATRNFTNDDDGGAFVGEFDANLTIRLVNATALRVGYLLMVADSVALAPEQFQQDATVANAALNSDGSILMHGAYVGLDLAW